MRLDLILIRHAESLGNLHPERIGGRSNHLELSEQGQAQAKSLGLRLGAYYPQADKLYSSPAVRTLRTAELALAHSAWKNCPPLQIEPALQELAQGASEGELRSEVYTPDRLQRMKHNPWEFHLPGGESQRLVEQRLLTWVETELLPQLNGRENPLVVYAFSHAVAIKCLFRGILQSDPRLSYRLYVGNTSINHFRFEPGLGWTIRHFNDLVHLQKA